MKKSIGWAFFLILFSWRAGLTQETPTKETPPPPPAEEAPSQIYDLAMTKGLYLLSEKKYDEAIVIFQDALKAKPNDRDARYYLGSSRRLLGQYDVAYETLKPITASDPSFQKVHFDLGVATYHLKRYDESLSELALAAPFETEDGARQAMTHYYIGLNYLALERFTEAAPKFIRAAALSDALVVGGHYHAGVAYYRQEIWDEAEDAFEEVLEKGPDSTMARSAKVYLKEIAKKKGDKPWHISTSLSLQQDSNVVLLSETSPLPTGITDQADLRAVVVLQGSVETFETEQWSGKAQYQLYTSFHQELDQFNVQSHDFGLLLVHRIPERPYRLDFSYHFSAASVDGNDYLNTHLLSAAVDLLRNPKRVTRVEYRFSDKDFLKSAAFPNNDDRTGTNNALDIHLKQSVFDQAMRINTGYTYDKESARETDWEYQGHRLHFSARVSSAVLRGGVEPALKIEFTTRQYDNVHTLSINKEKRDDQIQTVTLTFTRPFTEGIVGVLQYQQTVNGSNISVFDYKRQIISASTTVAF